MALQYEDLIREVSELKRAFHNMVRKATIQEQNGASAKLNFGPNERGENQISNWTRMAQFHGNGRYSHWFGEPKEEGGSGGGSSGGGGGSGGSGGGQNKGGGQNVVVICPSGDPSMSVCIPYSDNNNYQRPENASEDGKDGEFYQQKSHFRNYTPGTYEHWIEEEDQQGGSGGSGSGGSGGSGSGGGSSGQQKQRKTGEGGKAVIKQRGDKENGLTGRVGEDARYSAHKKGAMTWTKKAWHAATTDDDGNHCYTQCKGNNYHRAGKQNIVDKPWVIMNSPDQPIPRDDK